MTGSRYTPEKYCVDIDSRTNGHGVTYSIWIYPYDPEDATPLPLRPSRQICTRHFLALHVVEAVVRGHSGDWF